MENVDCQVVVEGIQISVIDEEKGQEESQNEDNLSLTPITTTTTVVEKTRGRPKKNGVDKKPLICEICERVLSSATKLIIHKRTHTGEKPFSCPHCDARFARKDKLQIHIRCHTGEKPHTCHLCFRSFVVGHKLNVHMRTSHDGIKPFACPHCALKFSRKDKLTLHIRTHTGTKPFVCSYCPLAKFSRKDKLIAHIKFHHPEEIFPPEFLKITYNNNSNADSEGQEVLAIKGDDESLRGITDSNEFSDLITHLPSDNNNDAENESNENSIVPRQSQNINNGSAPLVHSLGKNSRSSSKVHKCHVCKLLFATEMVLAQHLFKTH